MTLLANRNGEGVRSQLIELRRLLSGAMADEQRLYQRHLDSTREAERWRSRAGLAAERGEDELAKGALARASRADSRAAQYQGHYLEQKEYVERMKRRLLELESGGYPVRAGGRAPDAAEVEKSLLWLRAETERLRDERARLAAWAELERDELAEKLSALEREDQVERQLAELKAKLAEPHANQH